MSEMAPESVGLSLADYAEQAGKSLRTVQRWLADGRLPAYQDADGRWWVPADARPDNTPRRRTTSQPVAAENRAENTPGNIPGPGAPLGVLGTLEEAAAVLGTTVGGVRRMGRDGHLVVGPYGPHGGLRVWLPPR